MSKKTVYVIGPTFGIDSILPRYGYNVATDQSPDKLEAEIFLWMGGADIDPSLYKHRNVRSFTSPSRDKEEVALFDYALKHEKIKWGICRGAQLLNALHGGTMWQHVNNHSGSHPILDVNLKEWITTSVHHQMCRLPDSAKLIAWSRGISTKRIGADKEEEGVCTEPEVFYFPETNSFCTQGHPEFAVSGPTMKYQKMFFDYAKQYTGA